MVEKIESMVTPESIAYYKTKVMNQNGCFKAITEAIAHGFLNHHRYTPQRIEEFKIFLKSPVVHAWCDCSTNFEQSKLVIYYDNLLKGIQN
jgi:hypothetical protein